MVDLPKSHETNYSCNPLFMNHKRGHVHSVLNVTSVRFLPPKILTLEIKITD